MMDAGFDPKQPKAIYRGRYSEKSGKIMDQKTHLKMPENSADVSKTARKTRVHDLTSLWWQSVSNPPCEQFAASW